MRPATRESARTRLELHLCCERASVLLGLHLCCERASSRQVQPTASVPFFIAQTTGTSHLPRPLFISSPEETLRELVFGLLLDLYSRSCLSRVSLGGSPSTPASRLPLLSASEVGSAHALMMSGLQMGHKNLARSLWPSVQVEILLNLSDRKLFQLAQLKPVRCNQNLASCYSGRAADSNNYSRKVIPYNCSNCARVFKLNFSSLTAILVHRCYRIEVLYALSTLSAKFYFNFPSRSLLYR